MPKAVIVLAVTLLCSYPALSHADGIGSLIEVGKSMDEAKKELAAETARYDFVKRAVESGSLRKGLPRQAVMSQYGEPVVMNKDAATQRERWVYKPAASSFFQGQRICLYFDARGQLDEIRAAQ